MHRDLFMNCWHIAARQQHFADNATTFPAVCPVGNVFTACLTVFSRPRSDYVCEREWMCTNAAEGRRCCSWVLYAVSANGRCCFLFCTESDRCASSHDLSDTKPWKCSIRMQLFETQIPLFCSVDGLWRCSESFVLPSSTWLSLPPPSSFDAFFFDVHAHWRLQTWLTILFIVTIWPRVFFFRQKFVNLGSSDCLSLSAICICF